MKKEAELKDLGKEISNEFIKKNVPMNDSLVKIATREGLAKHEVERVAETANQSTYLKLLPKSPDHYVEFSVANPQKVNKDLSLSEQTKTSSVDDDYYKDLEDSRVQEFSLGMYGVDVSGEEKSASIEAYRKQADRLKGEIDYLEREFKGTKRELFDDYTSIYGHVKQAYLGGENFDNIVGLIKHAKQDDPEILINPIVNDLSKELPYDEFEKVASSTKEPKIDSSLYKDIKHFNVKIGLLEKIASVYEQKLEDYNFLVDQYKLGFKKESGIIKGIGEIFKGVGSGVKYVTKGTGKAMKAHPGITGLGVGAVATTPFAYSMGKSTERNKKNVLTRKNVKYIKNRLDSKQG